MKILAGAYTATSGEILIDGKPQTIRGPKDALAARDHVDLPGRCSWRRT